MPNLTIPIPHDAGTIDFQRKEPKPYQPTSADEMNIIGAMYHQQGRADIARLHYNAALLLDPDNPEALQNLAAALLTGSMIPASISIAKRAMMAKPENIHAKINLAAAYLAAGRFEDSRNLVQNVIDTPGGGIAAFYHNLGLCHANLGQFAQAIKAYNKSLELNPDGVLVKSDRALCLLSMGNFAEGIKAYEIRWNTLYKCAVWHAGIPEWKGEDLTGKHIIIHSEQGFGDGIMLVRFVKAVEILGAKITLAAPAELCTLFQQFGYPVINWEDKANIPLADYHVPMLNLLGLLEINPSSPTILGRVPYIHAILSPHLGPPGYRIGICWASGDHSFALAWRRRYCPLDKFFPLSEIPGVRLVSLQKGMPQHDVLNLGAESFIYDAMARVEDFQGTAEVIAGLDLVISVDSAVAHLAGAMGKKVIMLGPYVHCWRWNFGSETGLPWYRDFTILKQTIYGDWSGPVNQAIDIARKLVLNSHG